MRALAQFAREPIIIPRWMLVTKYVLFGVLGLVLIRAGSPSIEQATSAEYLIWYGSVITAAAVVAIVGCVIAEWVEMVGALALWSWLLVYVAATSGRALSGDPGIQSVSIIVLIVSLLPMVRGFSILFELIGRAVRRRRG